MSDRSKTALITGGSRGIGRAIAIALAESGYNCAISYVSNAAAAEETSQQIESFGRRALAIQADLASSDDRRRLVDRTFDELGSISMSSAARWSCRAGRGNSTSSRWMATST